MTPRNLRIIQIVLTVVLILTIVMNLGFIFNALAAIALIVVTFYGMRMNKDRS